MLKHKSQVKDRVISNPFLAEFIVHERLSDFDAKAIFWKNHVFLKTTNDDGYNMKLLTKHVLHNSALGPFSRNTRWRESCVKIQSTFCS